MSTNVFMMHFSLFLEKKSETIVQEVIELLQLYSFLGLVIIIILIISCQTFDREQLAQSFPDRIELQSSWYRVGLLRM